MSESVVSFTKPTGQVTPYWLLQQLGGIDAVLIFKFADKTANIKYDVPAERTLRVDYLREIVNGASDDFRLEYVNEIWDLVGLPRNECPAVNVSEIRVPLYPIFSENSKAAMPPPPVSISSVNRSTRFPVLSSSVRRSIFNE